MSPDIVQERQRAHEYLDRLPPTQLSAVRSLLETMLDPVTHALVHVPLDDEPFSEEDRQAVAEAEGWLKQNQPIPLETVLEDFGLTLSDWEGMGKTPDPDTTSDHG